MNEPIEMRKEHLGQVAELETICFSDPWSYDAFENELDNERSSYFVLENKMDESVEKAIIGYCGYWKIFDEAHIMNLAVAPAFRGKHLGDVLMQEMIGHARKQDIKHMTLEVREGNKVAKKLYEKYGFKVLGMRRNYYQDNGENALVMWAEI